MTAVAYTPERGVGWLIRDLRHMQARAASDLADWLVHLELEGKADRTLYAYHRALASLLRACPDKTVSEFTSQDVSDVLARVPRQSRHITRALEEHGQYLLKIGATRLGLKFLTLALNWRTAREAQR